MAITPLGASQAYGASVTLSVPPGVQAGDVLVAAIHSDVQGVVITPPAGWTLKREFPSPDDHRLAVFHRVAGSSEPADYTWTFSAGGASHTGILSAYRGVNTGVIWNADALMARTASGTNHSTPSILTTLPNALLIAVLGLSRGNSAVFTPPAGMSERGDIGTSWSSLTLADGPQAAAGNSGAKTFTANQPGPGITWLGALEPAASGPVSLTLTPASAQAQPVPLGPVPQPVSLSLNPASAQAVPSPLEPVAPPASVSLSPAQMTLASVPLNPQSQPVTLPLNPAQTSATPAPLNPGSGAASVRLEPATVTAPPVPLIPTPGATGVILEPVTATAQPVPLSPTPQAVGVNLGPAAVTAQPAPLGPQPGEARVALAPASVTAVAVGLLPLAGAAHVALQPGTVTAEAPELSSGEGPGGVVVSDRPGWDCAARDGRIWKVKVSDGTKL